MLQFSHDSIFEGDKVKVSWEDDVEPVLFSDLPIGVSMLEIQSHIDEYQIMSNIYFNLSFYNLDALDIKEQHQVIKQAVRDGVKKWVNDFLAQMCF